MSGLLLTKSRLTTGITLLEILFVMVIIASIFLASLKLYQYFHWRRETTLVRNRVQQLLAAGRRYYFQECSKWTWPFNKKVLSVDNLRQLNLMPSAWQNPWGNKFIVSVQGENFPVHIRVSTNMTRLPGGNPSTEYYHRLLMAAGVDGFFYWDRIPLMQVSPTDSNLWVLDSQLENFSRYFDKQKKSTNACFLQKVSDVS